jgi:hypothetical protein
MVKVGSTQQGGVDTPKAIQIKLVSGHVVYIPTTLAVSEIAALLQALGNSHA